MTQNLETFKYIKELIHKKPSYSCVSVGFIKINMNMLHFTRNANIDYLLIIKICFKCWAIISTLRKIYAGLIIRHNCFMNIMITIQQLKFREEVENKNSSVNLKCGTFQNHWFLFAAIYKKRILSMEILEVVTFYLQLVVLLKLVIMD